MELPEWLETIARWSLIIGSWVAGLMLYAWWQGGGRWW